MSGGRAFLGQLYESDPGTKGWRQLIEGPVSVSFTPASQGKWTMVARLEKSKAKVWEQLIEPGLRHKAKDAFVQWQQQQLPASGGSASAGTKRKMHGLRLSNQSQAREFNELLTVFLSQQSQQRSVAVQLKVQLPSQESVELSVNPKTTVSQLLKQVASQQQLDPTYFNLVTPPETPNGQATPLNLSMTVAELKSTEIMLTKKHKKEENVSLEVELPWNETSTFVISPSLTMGEILAYVCAKSGLDPSKHLFDLPIANLDSLRLQQLRISQIKMLRKDVGDDAGHDSDTSGLQKKKFLPGADSRHHSQELMAQLQLQLRKPTNASPPVVKKIVAASTAAEENTDGPAVGATTKSSPLLRKKQSPPFSANQVQHSPKQRSATVSGHGRKPAPPPPSGGKKSPSLLPNSSSADAIAKVWMHGGSSKRRAPPPPKPKQPRRSVEEVDLPTTGHSEAPSSPLRAARHLPPSPLTKKRVGPQVSPILGTSMPHNGKAGPHRKAPIKPAPLKPAPKLPGAIATEPVQHGMSEQEHTVRVQPKDSVQKPMGSSQDSSCSSQDQESSQTLQQVVKSLPVTHAPTLPLSENDAIQSLLESSKVLPPQPTPTKVMVGPGTEAGSKLLVISPCESQTHLQRPSSTPVVFKIPPPPPKPAKVSPEENSKTYTEQGTAGLHETRKAEDTEEEELSVDDSDTEESDKEEDPDLDRSSSTTSDSDDVVGYDIGSATQLHKSFEDSPISSDEEQVKSRLPPPATKTEVPPTFQEKERASPQWSSLVPVEPNSPLDSSQSSTEESDDDSNEDDDDEDHDGSGGIVLVSMKATPSSFSDVPEMLDVTSQLPEEDQGVEGAMQHSKEVEKLVKAAQEVEQDAGIKEKETLSVSSGFRELDTMLSSLRNLIADTCELGGKEEMVPMKSPDLTSAENINLSVIKEMAPPPDTLTHSVPKPQPTIPPPLKPKPSRSQEGSELLQKLRKRRELASTSPPKKEESDLPPPTSLPSQDSIPVDKKSSTKNEACAPSVSLSCDLQTSSVSAQTGPPTSLSAEDPPATVRLSSLHPGTQVPENQPSSKVHTTQPVLYTPSTQPASEITIAQPGFQVPQAETGSQFLQAQPDSQAPALQRLQWQFLQQQLMQQQMMGMQQMQQMIAAGLPQAQIQQMMQQMLLQQQQLMVSAGFVPNPMQTGLNPVQTGLNPMQTGLNPMQTGLNPMQTGLNSMQTGLNSMQTGLNPMQTVPSSMQAGLSPMAPFFSPMQLGHNPIQMVPNPTPAVPNPVQAGINPMLTVGGPMQMGPVPIPGQSNSIQPMMEMGGVMPGPASTQGQASSASLPAALPIPTSPVTATPTSLPQSSGKVLMMSDEPTSPILTSTPVDTASRKTSEADMRSSALGSAEKRFNTLMEEMRESDPTDRLRKTPANSDDSDTMSSYTEMTAALLEAMQERRKHVGDTPNKSGQNMSHSFNQSNDWDT